MAFDRIQFTEYLDLDLNTDKWRCNCCGRELISARENYKRGCLVAERDPSEIHPTDHRGRIFVLARSRLGAGAGILLSRLREAGRDGISPSRPSDHGRHRSRHRQPEATIGERRSSRARRQAARRRIAKGGNGHG